MKAKKLVLTYVDSLRTDMLERAVAEERAPTFAALLERGVLVPDCVSSFPSVTPVACAEMVTGVGADRHWISGMNWYHRLERRYVEYGSSLDATRSVGVFRALYDLVYNMNLAHLSPEVETLFERLDDAGARTACTPFLIYRGRHRHQVSLDGLLRRAVDATRLKFQHHTWGPRELFYGDLYASREVPCKSTSIPGGRDPYSACCAAEMIRADAFDFLLFSLADNDNYSHRHGPEASVESIARADDCLAELVEAGGGLDRFLDDHALILVADHAQTAGRPRPAAGRAARPREWSVLAPSDERPGVGAAGGQPHRPRRARVPAAGRGRAGRPQRGPPQPGPDRRGGPRLLAASGPTGSRCARPRWAWRPGRATVAVSSAAARGSASGPARTVEDLRGGTWEIDGALEALEATVVERAAEQRASTPTRWRGSSRRWPRRTPATSSSRSRRGTRRSTGAGPATPAAAATGLCTAATRSGRCSSSAAARTATDPRRPTASGRCGTSGPFATSPRSSLRHFGL